MGEFDVQMNSVGGAQIHLLQYPLRPRFRPYGDEGQLAAVRLQPGLMELDFTLTHPSPNYHSESRSPMETHTLVGSEVPMRTNYCIGVLKQSVLYLTPIAGTYQLRPGFRHLDAKEPAEERMQVQTKVGQKRLPVRHPISSDIPWESLTFSTTTDQSLSSLLTSERESMELDPELSSQDYIDMLLPQQAVTKGRMEELRSKPLPVQIEEVLRLVPRTVSDEVVESVLTLPTGIKREQVLEMIASKRKST